MPSAYEFIWGNNASANEVPQEEDVFGDDALGELGTELSPLPIMPSNSSVPVEWATGVIAGTCIAIQQLIPAGDKRFDPCEAFRNFANGDGTVVGLLEDLVKEPFQDQYFEFPSQHFGLTVPRHLTSYGLTRLQGPVSRVSDPERLAALLGVENKLVASNGPLDHEQFATVISGLASLTDSPESIKVVRVNHSGEDDYLDWFSIAVRVPRIGPISNASLWWVFHNIYATGTMDSDCIIAERRVDDTLQRFRERIDIEEISGVSTSDLLALCSSPVWKFLHTYSKRLQDVNSALRGAIPEMVSALLLSYWGYQHIKANFKPTALIGREIDAVGILLSEDGGDCMVIESKGSAETDEDLENEIIEFKSKIEDLREQLPQLSRDLGFGGDIKNISGFFVSMADLRHYERSSHGIELWDFHRFEEELRAAGVSEQYRNLLEKTSLTIVMRDFWVPPNLSLFEDDLPDIEDLSIEDLPYDE